MTSTDRPSTDARQHQRIKALFDRACELLAATTVPMDETPFAATEVGRALAAEGASADELRLVEALIARDRAAAARHQDSAAPSSAAPETPVTRMLRSLAAAEINLGDVLGPWRIDSVLGGGGMGTVYKATRIDGQFTQVAAIKVLVGLPSPEALAYLARERQILVSLSHPNIARLIDGGATGRGYPYLAMDYIDGTEIDRWCREQKLDTPAVVRLFESVAGAVEYAHQHLTLHCDIKPSNIMVDASGRPVLLDFGIAELVGGARGMGVGAPQAMFTPTFASPEQVAAEPLSTASDVYSLGRTLSVLLDDAARRGGQRIPTELAAIVKRATQESATLRYASVAAFARDLRAWRELRPVSAVPAGRAYRARKLLQRQWPVITAGVAFVAVVLGLALSALAQRDRAVVAEGEARNELKRALAAETAARDAEATARVARDRAEAESVRANREAAETEKALQIAATERDRARSAEAVSRRDLARAIAAEQKAQVEGNTAAAVRDFMIDLFADIDNGTIGARKLTAYELLERGKARIETRLVDQPQVQATTFRTLARVYNSIGDLDNAKVLYQRAIRMERDPKWGRREALGTLLGWYALAETNSANHAAAEAPAREALAIRREVHGEMSNDVADAHSILGLVLSNARKRDEARPHLEASLAIREKLYADKDEATASAAHNLGQFYAQGGEVDKAVAHYQRAIAIKTALFGAQHQKTFNSVEGLGQTLWRADRLTEAEPILAALYRGQEKVNGKQSERFASAADVWANVLFDLGRFTEAKVRFEEALAISAGIPLSERSFRYSSYANNYAILLEEMGDLVGAEASFRNVLQVRERLFEPEHLALARARNYFSRVLIKRGKLDEAGQMIEAAWKVRKKRLPATDVDLLDSRLAMIDLAVARRDLAAATATLAEMTLPANPPLSRRLAYLRAAASVDALAGRHEMAVQKWTERSVLTQRRYGATHPRSALAGLDHAEALLAAGRADEARRVAAGLRHTLQPALGVASSHWERLDRVEQEPKRVELKRP
jgi:serine/threonine-protein kinase